MLRKKVARKLLSADQAEVAWEVFNSLGILMYVNDVAVMRTAWRIAEKEKLPTLYDAAYTAVSEIISRQTNEVCEFWTADERMVNSVKGKSYVKLLHEWGE